MSIIAFIAIISAIVVVLVIRERRAEERRMRARLLADEATQPQTREGTRLAAW